MGFELSQVSLPPRSLPESLADFLSRFFGDFLRKSRESRQALTEMLCQFARLAGKFLAMDVRTLEYYARANNDQEPDLGSRVYL
jgi:ubiquitin carboxyl-terminal hydrolase 34